MIDLGVHKRWRSPSAIHTGSQLLGPHTVRQVPPQTSAAGMIAHATKSDNEEPDEGSSDLPNITHAMQEQLRQAAQDQGTVVRTALELCLRYQPPQTYVHAPLHFSCISSRPNVHAVVLAFAPRMRQVHC